MKTNLLKSIFISLILVLGVSNAWAASEGSSWYDWASSENVYFDNTNSSYTNVSMLIGRQWTYGGDGIGSSGVNFTKVDNTNNLYHAATTWNHYNTLLFMDATNWGWEGNKVTQRYTYADNYTNTNNIDINGTELFYAASSTKGATLNHQDLSGYAALNSRQTIQSVVDGTVANSKATISITSYKMTAHKKTTEQTATLGTGADASYIDAARTATTTFTVGDVATGYQFDGWYTAATGGTELSRKKTYTYYPTAAATVYARFSTIKYTVTYGVHSSGNGTLAAKVGSTSISSGNKENYGSKVVFTATPSTGYEIEGWYSNTDCTTSLNNGTDKTYTIESLTAEATVYVKFKRKQPTVNFGVHSSGNGTLTAKVGNTGIDFGDKVNYGSEVVFTAKPDDGYQIEGWYSNSTCTTPIDNGTNKTYTVTITGGTNVYVKFVEIPVNSHNITYTEQGTGWTYGNANPTTAEEGATVTFVVNPTAGYRVSVSSDGPTLTGPNANNQYTFTMPTKDVQITVDAKPEQYTVTLNKQSGEGGTSSVTATYLAAMPTITPPTRTGYTFNGYFDATSGGTKYYNANGSSAKNWDKTSNTTLYAQWTANTYTITYKDQGGSDFSGVHASGHPTTHTYGTATTLKDATKIGYTFDGWFTTSACTGTAVTSLGATDYTSNITLYAKWTEIPPTTIYIKSDGNYADFKWNYNSVAYDMEKVDCDGTYYTADILGGVEEITLTGSNSFTTTTLTVPTDGKTLYDISQNIIYLKPNSNWTQGNARFAAYVWNSGGNAWFDMTDANKDGIYECEIPTTYTSVIFCRMNPKHSDNRWNNDQDTDDTKRLWNQTSDLTIPTDAKNLYTVKSGTWDKGGGEWSAHYDNSRWTTYSAPTLELRINITGKGSIVIDGETYTSESKGTTALRVSKTNGKSIAIGAITAADRWEYNNDAEITMCDETIDLAASHTINGPATINLSFTQTSCEVVFNLNLPRGTEHPLIPAQYVAVGEKATQPTLNEINDYIFGGWYSDKNCTQAYNFENSVTTDITIHAKWVLHSQCIFFRNTLGWKDIYVYTFSDDMWHKGDNQEDAKDDKGVQPKVNRIEYGKMTQMGESDIYYYILTNLTGFSHIAFKDNDQSGYDHFFGGNAIYRSDRNDQMPLFIPEKDQLPSTTNSTKYYSSGIWMKYNSTESGYEWRGATSEDANDSGWSNAFKFTTDKPGGYSFKASVTFDNINQHYFKVRNYNNTWFGNGGTMDQNNCTDWIFGSDNSNNAKITPTITGTYIFTVYLGDGVVKVSLDFPLSTGDYRLVYVDNVTGVHPGHYIKKRNENRLDTVSFFVHHQNSPRILLQHCTAISNSGVPTWKTDKEYQILKTGGADPTSAQLPGKRKSDAVLYTGEGCGIEESGVYNFVLQQSNSTADLQTDYTHPYVGDFYIRTDAAEGGWDSFRQKSNQITYSSFADAHSNFNHYYCKYIDAGRNVKFTIANDYSYCISDTLDNDDIIKEGQSSIGCLPNNASASANVRFGWDSNTNEISRAYIKGAGMTSDRFLVLQGKDNNLKDANGNDIPVGTGDRTGLLANEEILVDQQNWIYQVDVTANNATLVKLIAEYNGTTQYFKGNDKEYTRLLSSSATKNYKIRLVYDFKSNHLVIAWLAGGNTVANTEILGADMMVIRKDQNKADQLNFNPQNSSTMDSVKTGYAVMTFTKAHLENLQADNKTPLPDADKKSERERSLYWVSFPFDVKVSDVFGFGEYAEHWILQYYDGKERAEKGLFSDSGTYWKYIFDTDTKLKAGEGYVLVLDLSKVEFLYGATEVSLYFPSTNPLTTITGNLPTAATVPAHWCNIDREFEDGEKRYNHKFTDSHWNLIGVPGFADINNFNDGDYHFMQEDISFYYKFDLTKNIYTVEKNYTVEHATNFQAMYSYMVQFAGTIYWMSKTVEGVTPQPEELAARRYSDDQPEKVALRLELAQGEEVADRTFIQLQQEGATANFDLSLDLTKIVNIGVSNIYTLTDSLKIQTAGNVLPFEETTVAVGVDIATDGEYTFRMPDGTEGMVVELIDYETNTTTNLLLDDYTVNLPTGSNETRFALSIKPEKTATSIESTTTPSDSNIRKFIIDGKLYLQKDGMLYDAQGKLMR